MPGYFYSCIACAGASCDKTLVTSCDEETTSEEHDGEPCEVCEKAVCVPIRVLSNAVVAKPLLPFYEVTADSGGNFSSELLTGQGIVLEDPVVREFTRERRMDETLFTDEELEAWERRNDAATVVAECIAFCSSCWSRTRAGERVDHNAARALKISNDHIIRQQVFASMKDDAAEAEAVAEAEAEAEEESDQQHSKRARAEERN